MENSSVAAPASEIQTIEDPYIKKSFVLSIDEKYRQWDIIAKSGYGYIVLSHDALFRMSFGTTDRWKDAYCRSYLNDVWLAPVKTGLSLKNIPEDEMLDYRTERSFDKIFLLSKSEYCDWRKTIPQKTLPYWLRTPYGHLHNPYLWVVDTMGNLIGDVVHNSSNGIVPAIYLSKEAIQTLV
ncbi:MAG: hypothetical protein K5639_00415 [Eubacterium sp.]|nr:hypothetical protein [Eubacterium sp.]